MCTINGNVVRIFFGYKIYIHDLWYFFFYQVSDESSGVQPDDLIMFLQLAGERDEVGENKYDLSLLTATGAAGGMGGPGAAKDDKLKSQLNKVTD